MYRLNEEQRANVLKLLDRTPVKGLQEIEAVVDIINALSSKEGGKEDGE